MFNSPLLLGFDQLERTLDRLAKNAEGYPPIISSGSAKMACASRWPWPGFTSDDLVIESGREPADGSRQAGRGRRPGLLFTAVIAARQFQRAFMLADGIEVIGARLDNGLLSIDLVRPVFEAAHSHHSYRRRRQQRRARAGQTIDITARRSR